jgi:cyclomaltodextrin glucanotransferase
MNMKHSWASPKLAFGIAGLALAVSSATFSEDYYGTLEPFAEEAVYFVVTDRFVNGDTSNDQRSQGTFDIELCPNGTNIGYLGGDFKGIVNNADYIAEMGFTSVWITPIVHNPNAAFTGGGDLSCGTGVGADKGKTGYHGYWADNFYQIDEHWESADLSFQEFNTQMESVHGLKTVLDIVANHGSPSYSMPSQIDNFGKIFDENWNLLADHQNLDPNQLDHGNTLHQWYNKSGGLAQLSDLNENNPAVMDYLVGAYLKWINQGVDAFRIDTIAWMPHSFWKEFSDRIRAENPGFYMFGENFNFDAGTIAQHQKPENGGISVLDFPGRSAMTGVFQNASSSYSDILWYLDLAKETYTNPYDLATFYDNHDMSRMSSAGNSSAFIDANNWMFTSRGIPVVYYGSEMAFMNGASEHSGNRNYYGESNIATARSTQTFQSLKAIANVRKNSVALQKGVQVNGAFSGQTATFFRVFEKDGVTQTALVFLNKGGNSETFNQSSLISSGDWVDAETGEVFSSTGSISTSVAAHDVKVLLLNAPTTNAAMLVALEGPAEKVTLLPIIPVTGQNVLVTYAGTQGQSYELHWGINNWAGAGSPAGDEPMSFNNDTGRYEATIAVPSTATQLDFVFHNLNDDSWDNNGGSDWHYDVDDQPCNCAPVTPTGLGATAADQQVSLSWSNAATATSYDVEVSQAGTVVSTVSVTSNSAVISGLTNEVLYSFTVTATNSFGTSDASTMVTATPTNVIDFDSNFGADATLHLTGIEFSNWDPANTEYQLSLSANNTWSTVVSVPTTMTNAVYKFTLNGSWSVNWGGGANGLSASLNRSGSDATVSLSAGNYNLTVVEGSSTNAAINVTWEKIVTGTPDLAVNPSVLNLGELIVDTQSSGTIALSNVGGGALVVEGASESATWMTASVSGLTATVNVDATGLVVGQLYSDNVLVSSNGGDEFVEVRFTVAAAPSGIDVVFTCNNGHTNSGQSVYVVGANELVGNWDPALAIKLDPTSYPTWTGTITIPAQTSFEWKCIKRDEIVPSQNLVWQGGANNALSTPANGTANTTGSF